MNEELKLSTPQVWMARIGLLCAMVALWELAAQMRWLPPILIGSPSGVAQYFWQEVFVTGNLLSDFYWSIGGTMASFVLGSAAGILVGMVFVSSPTTESVLDPFFTAMNAMPRLALAPLFLIWFGLGIGSKIAVGFSLTFFIVLSSTVAGGRGVNPDHLTLARTLGASKSQIFRKFVLPGAVPVIFGGLRLGLIYALLGVIATEMLASEHGLGQQLSFLAASFKTNGVFAIIFMLSFIGVLINWSMTWLEKNLLRWR